MKGQHDTKKKVSIQVWHPNSIIEEKQKKKASLYFFILSPKQKDEKGHLPRDKPEIVVVITLAVPSCSCYNRRHNHPPPAPSEMK